MNPHWMQMIASSLSKVTRICPHCGRRGVYPPKLPGQIHLCKHCHHRFQEKEKPTRAT
jgi:transposase-like protein